MAGVVRGFEKVEDDALNFIIIAGVALGAYLVYKGYELEQTIQHGIGDAYDSAKKWTKAEAEAAKRKLKEAEDALNNKIEQDEERVTEEASYIYRNATGGEITEAEIELEFPFAPNLFDQPDRLVSYTTFTKDQLNRQLGITSTNNFEPPSTNVAITEAYLLTLPEVNKIRYRK